MFKVSTPTTVGELRERNFPLTLVIGGGVWALLALVQPRLAVWILAFAPTVVVPLGLNLIERDGGIAWSPFWKLGRWLHLPTAALFVISFCLEQSWLAATLAMPWLVVTLLFALAGVAMVWRNGRQVDRVTALGGALLLLPVGAGWAALSRAGLQPQGFSHEIVLLTGVHFHYAGFALPILTASAVRQFPIAWERALIVAVVLGVPLVGVGISLSQHVEVVAAVLLAVACLTVAMLQLRAALKSRNANHAMLLLISVSSLAAAMLLAAVYALGEFTANDWLSISTMVQTHGVLNAFGFVLCGLIARSLEAADRGAL